MDRHELKVWDCYMPDLLSHNKNFEVRKNDRDFKINDFLYLKGFDPKSEKFTGCLIIRRITYILKGGQFGIKKGYVVLGLAIC